MADVAALAQVSPQTVSRVSTGADAVKPKTREAVLAAMQELGYVPNTAARALRYGSFHTLGVVAHRFSRTGISHIVEAVVDSARERGYAVSLVDLQFSPDEGFEPALAQLGSLSVDGLIVLRAETSMPDDFALPGRLPVVLQDARFIGPESAVGSDDVFGTQEVVRHLLELGHHTVHHVTGPADSVPGLQRLATWRAALQEAGRPVPEPIPGDWTPASGYAAGVRLAREGEATAVFCGNDEMATGLYRALHEHGLNVPHDISVVGFDDVLGQYLWPPLTTVAQDFERVGRTLVEVLLSHIDDPERAPGSHTLVPTELVVRSSTGSPRSAI
jgi:DNA-binding LacI/PurR family transcriptional regulator